MEGPALTSKTGSLGLATSGALFQVARPNDELGFCYVGHRFQDEQRKGEERPR